MRRNLVDGAQMGIPLRRRDVPVAHDLFPNRLRLAQLGQQRRGRVPQRVEGGAADRAAEGEPGPFDRELQAAANGLDGPLPVLDDVGVACAAARHLRISRSCSLIGTTCGRLSVLLVLWRWTVM